MQTGHHASSSMADPGGSDETITTPKKWRSVLATPRRLKNAKRNRYAWRVKSTGVKQGDALNRDVWEEVYRHLNLQDAARLATIDKHTRHLFKQRFEREQVRVRSMAEECLPAHLQTALFRLVRCGLQNARALEIEPAPNWAPISYSVNILGHVRILDPFAVFHEKICVIRHVCGHVVCYVNMAPGEDVMMDIRWGRCHVRTSKSINPERAMGFLLLLMDEIRRVGEDDASNPVGLLNLTHVCISFELLMVGTSKRNKSPKRSCRGAPPLGPSGESGIQKIFSPILPFTRTLIAESYPKFTQKTTCLQRSRARDPTGVTSSQPPQHESANSAESPDIAGQIDTLKVKVYCKQLSKGFHFQSSVSREA
jgi:hypothetical protein